MATDLELCLEYVDKVVKRGGTQKFACDRLKLAHFAADVIEEAAEVQAERYAAEGKVLVKGEPHDKVVVPKPAHVEHVNVWHGAGPWKAGFLGALVIGIILLLLPWTRTLGEIMVVLWLLLVVNTLVVWLGASMFQHGENRSFWKAMETAGFLLLVLMIIFGVFMVVDKNLMLFATLLALIVLTLVMTIFFSMSKNVAMLFALMIVGVNVLLIMGAGTVEPQLFVRPASSDSSLPSFPPSQVLGMDLTQDTVSNAVAVSGTGTDGLQGVREIKYAKGDDRLALLQYTFSSDDAAKRAASLEKGFLQRGDLMVRRDAAKCLAYMVYGSVLDVVILQSSSCEQDIAAVAGALRPVQ
jgi:hypothetical protein